MTCFFCDKNRLAYDLRGLTADPNVTRDALA
eukprot:SAG31_NODE_3461_length_4248_cov_1.470234_4_plen_31_part_00